MIGKLLLSFLPFYPIFNTAAPFQTDRVHSFLRPQGFIGFFLTSAHEPIETLRFPVS